MNFVDPWGLDPYQAVNALLWASPSLKSKINSFVNRTLYKADNSTNALNEWARLQLVKQLQKQSEDALCQAEWHSKMGDIHADLADFFTGGFPPSNGKAPDIIPLLIAINEKQAARNHYEVSDFYRREYMRNEELIRKLNRK